MPVPLIVWGIAALGAGFIGGALARQPEINNLHSQVEQLQEEIRELREEIERLQRLVEEQNRQIQTLTMKYHTMKGIHFIEKARAKKQAKGAIMYTYCLREYLELRNKELTQDYECSDDEVAFVIAFSMVLEGTMTNSSEDIAKKQFIKVYIRNLYAVQIDSLEECPIQKTLEQLGESI